MELVEDVDEFPQLCSLCLGAQLEGLNSTPHELPAETPSARALASSDARSSGDIRTINRADAAMSALYIYICIDMSSPISLLNGVFTLI